MSSSSLQRERYRASKPVLTSPRPAIARPDALEQLIAAVARLQEKAVQELRERRTWLRSELSSVDAELAELAELTAETAKPASVETSASVEKRTVTLPELIAELQAAPDRKLNIRKANFEVEKIKVWAKAHPQLLKLGGKNGWPTVTLLGRPKEKSPGAKNAAPHPDLFD